MPDLRSPRADAVALCICATRRSARPPTDLRRPGSRSDGETATRPQDRDDARGAIDVALPAAGGRTVRAPEMLESCNIVPGLVNTRRLSIRAASFGGAPGCRQGAPRFTRVVGRRRWVGLLLLVGHVACVRPDAAHCANRSGDPTCRARNDGRDFCSACVAAHDGCVFVEVADPECVPPIGAGVSTGEPLASSSSSTPATTGSSVGGSDASEGTAAAGESSSGGGTTGSQPACGNDFIEAPEVCDGFDLDGLDCATLELDGGTLSCRADCTGYDTSQCDGVPHCGNGVAELDEQCDGEDLLGETCLALPAFADGLLACDQSCALNTTACAPCKGALSGCAEAGECCSGTCSLLSLVFVCL
jgi:hypothetical protein